VRIPFVALFTMCCAISPHQSASPQSTALKSLPGIRVNLTIQEAIYAGISGFSRRQEPVTVGIPLPDAAGIQSVSQLGLAGASVGQFRVLGRWPSGNIEWLLVDTLADLAAGKTNNAISLTNGTGNFGGSNLATEDTSGITVSTGAANFVVRKNKFDLIDEAAVRSRTLIKPHASEGLVIVGPAPGNTACPCSTVYASSNDQASNAVIEENGSVRAVVRATGRLQDDDGHAYMRYTVRLHFYKGKSRVKAVVILQNADYGPSNSFASAYKGFQSFEARLTPNLGTEKTFSFGTTRSPATGSFAGSENSYLYQGFSDKMLHPHWSSPDSRSHYAPRSYIKRDLADQSGSHRTWNYSQDGWAAFHKDQTVAHGGHSDYPAGWADLSDSNGAGIEMGAYQMAAYWPKSVQFMNGGSEVRIGIWPDQSLLGSGGQDYFQAWPQYSMHTLYFNFHASKVPDPDGEFERFQYPLIARAPASYYNETKALLYPLVDPEREDNYFKSLNVACCVKDVDSPHVYRTYNWATPGAGNQAEMRWSDLMLWLQRGYTGRYIDAAHFYAFQVEQVFPRSDYDGATRFHWRDRPDSELDPEGLPERIVSQNDNLGCDPKVVRCGRNWIDNAHAHWYGMMDYYFLTGDETIKDAIEDGASDLYANPNVKVVRNGTYWNPRNIGEALMSDARLAIFYKAVGNSQAADNALQAGTLILEKQVWPELQVSGSGSASQGVSRTRGLHFGCCPPSGNRVVMPFQEGILSEGLWEFLQAEGPDWLPRQHTFDLAYGISNWTLNEAWRTNGNRDGCRVGSGPTYEIFLDHSNSPLDPSCSQTVWFNFYNYAKYAGDSDFWKDRFAQYIKHLTGHGSFFAEYGSIFEDAVISEVLDPQPLQLVSTPAKVEQINPATYRLSWTVPEGTQSYRIKYSDRNIVEWLNFDPVINQFAIDPAANIPWFAASDAPGVPAPAPAGTMQTFEIRDLDSKKQWHFAVKTYVHRKR
jgi:YetA-like protein